MIFLLEIWKRIRLVGYFLLDNWKFTLPAVLILILLIVGYRSCGKKAKLNEAEIQKAEQAVKERNDAELKQILVESDVREKQIDANVANANAQTINAIKEARDKYMNMNTEELARELEARK